MSFPTKEERGLCWGARDKYWECLDKNKSTSNEENCKDFRKVYENLCSAQWVKHFDRKRNYLQFKETIEKKGYEPLDDKFPAKAKVINLLMNQGEYIIT